MATEQTVDMTPSVGASNPDNLTGQKRMGKPKKSKGAMRRDLAFYIMLLPGVLVLFINNYLPMIGVIMPFENYRYDGNFFSSLFSSQFVGFDNFKFMFATGDAINAMKNTILYNIVFIALDVVVPIALAIAMSQMWNKRGANFYQSAMFLPYFISWVAVSYVAYAFFIDNGFVNTNVLSLFGVKPVEFYAETKAWPFILTFFHLWKYTGYNLIVYIASLSGISGEYYEAASLDGATKWQQVKYITLPMLKTTMIILTLLAVGRIFNGDFDLFFNVPKDTAQLYDVTDVLDTYVYRCLLNLGDVSMSAAAGIFQAVVGCAVVLLANLGVRKVDPDSALF